MTARILIIDDVSANAKRIQDGLAQGYFVTNTVIPDDAALECAETWQPDLILLNATTPNAAGLATCRSLKANPLTSHIPVIVLAPCDTSARLQALIAGADEVLTSPTADALCARVRGLVRLKRTRDEWRVRSEAAQALGLGGGNGAALSVVGARALVVDGLDHGAETALDALRREGVIATRARTETEALALAGSAEFDLVMLSTGLDGDDPLRLAARLRAEQTTRDVPLLVIAEPEQHEEMLRGFDLGANEWVLRPVTGAELRVRARNQIRHKLNHDRQRMELGQALELALTDPMTGLYNQRYLMRHIEGLLAAGQPEGIAAMMIDIDHFKSVNDRWGHAAGDQMLCQVADTLRQRIRMFDGLARYGGEEFVVVMSGVTTMEAVQAAERLRHAVQAIAFVPAPSMPFRLTVSIGVVRSSDAAVTPRGLLGAADKALYRAKRAGRNRVEAVAMSVLE